MEIPPPPAGGGGGEGDIRMKDAIKEELKTIYIMSKVAEKQFDSIESAKDQKAKRNGWLCMMAIRSMVMQLCRQLGVDSEEVINYKPKESKEPSLATMQRWMDEGVARATDGCRVEPDGKCVHGCESWLLAKGMI